MKIKKPDKLVANLPDKKEYVMHVSFKKVLNHELVLKKFIDPHNTIEKL